MKTRTEQVIELADWNNLVIETYGKPYSFQQQDGCQERGRFNLTIPAVDQDFENDTVPEIVNDEEMGVSFAAWLVRDPKQPLPGQTQDYQLRLWWERNFYPSIETVANDLHAKGLLEGGTYSIDIDW